MKSEESKKPLSFVALLLGILCVFACVIGLYTFYNAKGMSYFSNESEACNNCHIMNEVYNDYLKGSHSKKVAGKPRATCNDCHLPHGFVEKWIAKAESGVGHAYAFTFKLDVLPTNLSATQKSKGMIQDNCVRCHSEMVSNVVNPTTNPHGNSSLSCVSCHNGVGHRRGF